MNFEKILEDKVQNIEHLLKKSLPEVGGYQSVILEAMEYNLMAGGKRIRPLLMLESFGLFDGKGESIHYFMAAMEMIHTYSLVHDDLPAMDDDDYRRGRKTTHIVYGEDMAILTGDALLNFAFERASEAFDLEPEQALNIGKCLKVLSQKAGVYGMIGGQVIDVKSSGCRISKEVLDEIYSMKTGALIEASMMIGGILGGATQAQVEILEHIGKTIGMAFQIQDDILDVTSTAKVLGKPILSDEKNKKTTYVTLIGLDESKKLVQEISNTGIHLLQELPGDSKFLEELITMLIYRKK